jgi:CRP/FNR family transcriptional regulator
MADEEIQNGPTNIHDSSTCFHHLYQEEFELLSDKKKQLTYYPGENLFKQGAFAPYVMYVLDGLVKIFLQTGPDKQINIRLARAGDFLAFSVVFGQSVYAYSAVALKPSRICMVDKQALHQLLMRNPEFAMQITSRNMQYENQLFEIIRNISYKQMRGKLASALLYLSTDDFIQEQVFQHLTRQDIAQFANISTENTIKFLKEFEKDNILTLDGKDVHIKDKAQLEQLARLG